MISKFLEFARPQKLKKTEIQLKSLVDGIISELNVPKRVGLEIDVSGKTNVSVDPDTFRQALVNIFQNSLDSLSGKGRIIVTESIRDFFNEKYTCITIEDNGPGIRPEDREKIFDPFFTKKNDGVGLGLSITFKIIKMHGGHIKVESEMGKYTRFMIYLP